MNTYEQNVVDALSPLRDESPAPPRIDLATVMAEGRRRRRTVRLATAGGTLAAVTVVAVLVPLGVAAVRGSGPSTHPASTAAGTSARAVAPTSLTCTEQLLPVPDGVTKALVSGGDPTGKYLFGRSYPQRTGFHEQPLLWIDGVAHKIAIPGEDPTIGAVTSNGKAIGSSFNGDVETGYFVSDGKVTRLAGPKGSTATDLNSAGVIVGGRFGANGVSVPIMWKTPTSEPIDLRMPGPNWVGSATAINDDGTIVGEVSTSAHTVLSRTIVWQPDGSFQLIPLPTLAGVSGINSLLSFNLRGNVLIGEASVVTSQETAFYPLAYDLGTGKFTDLQHANLWVTGGNSQHWLAGEGIHNKPAIWTSGTGLVLLPTLTSKPDTGDQASFISEDGTIVAGQNTDRHGVIRAVEWRCH
ncbi:MAG TPA: hypothetical protein VKB59_19850 [Micromonosporaceae bacterium]|nr:hypothetical protein [Micromonosporaceae bacterium]